MIVSTEYACGARTRPEETPNYRNAGKRANYNYTIISITLCVGEQKLHGDVT